MLGKRNQYSSCLSQVCYGSTLEAAVGLEGNNIGFRTVIELEPNLSVLYLTSFVKLLILSCTV